MEHLPPGGSVPPPAPNAHGHGDAGFGAAAAAQDPARGRHEGTRRGKGTVKQGVQINRNDDEDIGENQFSANEVHASGYPVPAAAGRNIFHLRLVSYRNGGDTGQGASNDGVSEPGTAGSADQGRRHRQQVREYGQSVGQDTGLLGRGQHRQGRPRRQQGRV